MTELSDAQCDRIIAAIKGHPAPPSVLDALWGFWSSIDDPFDSGWLSGLLETLEGAPPYSDAWPPPTPGTHSSD